MIKFVKSQKTGEYVKIGPEDMDYNTRFAMTSTEMKVERDAIIRAISGTAEQQTKFDSIINRAKTAQGLL